MDPDMIMIHLMLYSIPDPPKAYSLAKAVAKMSTMAAQMVMMSWPHSK